MAAAGAAKPPTVLTLVVMTAGWRVLASGASTRGGEFSTLRYVRSWARGRGSVCRWLQELFFVWNNAPPGSEFTTEEQTLANVYGPHA